MASAAANGIAVWACLVVSGTYHLCGFTGDGTGSLSRCGNCEEYDVLSFLLLYICIVSDMYFLSLFIYLFITIIIYTYKELYNEHFYSRPYIHNEHI